MSSDKLQKKDIIYTLPKYLIKLLNITPPPPENQVVAAETVLWMNGSGQSVKTHNIRGDSTIIHIGPEACQYQL